MYVHCLVSSNPQTLHSRSHYLQFVHENTEASVLSEFSTKSFFIAFLICDFGFLIHLSSSPDCKFLEGRRLVLYTFFQELRLVPVAYLSLIVQYLFVE